MAHPHPALITERAAALTADPIFAIDRYRRAFAALEKTNERVNAMRFAAAEDELGASGEALFATKPTIPICGCRLSAPPRWQPA